MSVLKDFVHEMNLHTVRGTASTDPCRIAVPRKNSLSHVNAQTPQEIQEMDEFVDSDNPDEILVVLRVGRKYVYTKPLLYENDADVREGQWLKRDVQIRVNRRMIT